MRNFFTIVLMSVLGWSVSFAQPFVPGNVVVYRAGDGIAPLRSVSTKIFLDEYSPAGVLVRSIAMPTTASGANFPLTGSGTATSEGYINRSVNNEFLLLGGYASDTGVVSIASSTVSTYKRVVAIVDANGNVNTATVLDSAFSGGNIRSVISPDGSALWISGSNSGIRYTTAGVTADKRITTTSFSYPANYRALQIFGGQLYASTSSGTTYRLVTVGTGTPVDTGNLVAQLPGIGVTGLPNQYFFADINGTKVLYVADEAAQTSNGGIQKYTFNGTTWTSNGTLYINTSMRGLTGVVTGTVVNLFATTPTDLYQVTDASGPGNAITGTPVSIATAGANTAFRGVAMAPEIVAPLKLVSFTGLLSQGAIHLKWLTANEYNVKGFSVERSADGRQFSLLGSVDALNKSEANYNFSDNSPLKGSNYYRLIMIDKDGKQRTSEIITVNTTRSSQVSVFPNPVNGVMNVTHNTAISGASIKIMTTNGQIVKTFPVQRGATQSKLEVADLIRGNYLVVFENNGEKEIAKFIKQ